MFVILTPATVPAELGDAATQADMIAFNALLEERGLVGKEVKEEVFLALLDEAAQGTPTCGCCARPFTAHSVSQGAAKGDICQGCRHECSPGGGCTQGASGEVSL